MTNKKMVQYYCFMHTFQLKNGKHVSLFFYNLTFIFNLGFLFMIFLLTSGFKNVISKTYFARSIDQLSKLKKKFSKFLHNEDMETFLKYADEFMGDLNRALILKSPWYKMMGVNILGVELDENEKNLFIGCDLEKLPQSGKSYKKEYEFAYNYFKTDRQYEIGPEDLSKIKIFGKETIDEKFNEKCKGLTKESKDTLSSTLIGLKRIIQRFQAHRTVVRQKINASNSDSNQELQDLNAKDEKTIDEVHDNLIWLVIEQFLGFINSEETDEKKIVGKFLKPLEELFPSKTKIYNDDLKSMQDDIKKASKAFNSFIENLTNKTKENFKKKLDEKPKRDFRNKQEFLIFFEKSYFFSNYQQEFFLLILTKVRERQAYLKSYVNIYLNYKNELKAPLDEFNNEFKPDGKEETSQCDEYRLLIWIWAFSAIAIITVAISFSLLYGNPFPFQNSFLPSEFTCQYSDAGIGTLNHSTANNSIETFNAWTATIMPVGGLNNTRTGFFGNPAQVQSVQIIIKNVHYLNALILLINFSFLFQIFCIVIILVITTFCNRNHSDNIKKQTDFYNKTIETLEFCLGAGEDKGHKAQDLKAFMEVILPDN